jgi:hypothetical protein
VTWEIREDASETVVGEWFEDRWVAIDEVALAMEEDEGAARGSSGFQNEAMQLMS